jgi:hypothetical protein
MVVAISITNVDRECTRGFILPACAEVVCVGAWRIRSARASPPPAAAAVLRIGHDLAKVEYIH